ncbi:hypothetical protein L6452_32969 [Arctium lappa]|uniref:Uncharacterized protein n=1 Tax=Arctium lappa TaxID=4217 RepID=A0ACB8Z646_ARCLA|nr:hypothetical protein L6452_32969 [Arctium lappa]
MRPTLPPPPTPEPHRSLPMMTESRSFMFYSKEISKRMLDYMNSRSASPAQTMVEEDGGATAATTGDSGVHYEDGSTGKTRS